MDIKAQITKAVKQISRDKSLQEQFQKEPVRELEVYLALICWMIWYARWFRARKQNL